MKERDHRELPLPFYPHAFRKLNSLFSVSLTPLSLSISPVANERQHGAEPWAAMLEFNSSSPFCWLHDLGHVIEPLPLHASVYSSGIAVIQSLSHVQLFVTPWTCQASPCPSPSPRACSNSCPSSQWCHSTISSCVIPFSCLQSFPASRSFLMSQLFA